MSRYHDATCWREHHPCAVDLIEHLSPAVLADAVASQRHRPSSPTAITLPEEAPGQETLPGVAAA